jgi:flagellar basal-body rod protein FlgB
MDTTISALSQALDLGTARLGAISNNLANVNTPGFKRQDATFAALLQDAQDAGGDAGSTGPTLTTQRSGSMRPDGNNVDIDAETSRMAATEIYYQGAAQLLNMQFAGLKYEIAGGR